MNVTIVNSGQGLLSVNIDSKPSDWKISNTNGIWRLYHVKSYGKLEFPDNLSTIIHQPEKLTDMVIKLLSDYNSSRERVKL